MKLNARFKLVAMLLIAIDNSHMANTKEKLGKKIQKLRKALGYTQEELAEKLNISRTHMGHIEQARKAPSLKLMDKLAKVLKVKLSDLF